MDHRPKWKTQNFKLLEDKIRENLGDVGFGEGHVRQNIKDTVHERSWILLKSKISALRKMSLI